MADNGWIDALLGNKTTAQVGSLLSADQIDEGSVSNAYTRTAAAIPGKTDAGSEYWYARDASDTGIDTTSDATTTDDTLLYPLGSGDSRTDSINSQSQSSAKASTPGVSVADTQGGNMFSGVSNDAISGGLGLLGNVLGYSEIGDVAQLGFDIATNSPDSLSNAGQALTGLGISSIAGSNPLTSLGVGLVNELGFEEDPDIGKPVAGFSGAYGGAMLGAFGGPITSLLGAMLGGGLMTGSYVDGAIGDALNSRDNEELRDYLEDNDMSYSDTADIASSASRYDKSQDPDSKYDSSGATGPTGSSSGKDSDGNLKGDSVSGAEPVSQRGYVEQETPTTFSSVYNAVFGSSSSSSNGSSSSTVQSVSGAEPVSGRGYGDNSGRDNNVGGDKGSSTGTGGGYNDGKGGVSGL